MSKILIRNADWVVTMDPERRLIKNGAVAIQGDKIVEVCKTSEMQSNFEANKVIDAKGKIVTPGFIDGHLHNTQFLTKGNHVGIFLKQALFERIYPYEASLTYDDCCWSSYACQTELIHRGVTTFIESGSYYPDAVGEVTKKTGLRAIMARSAIDIHGSGIGQFPPNYPGRETMEQALSNGEATVRKWHDILNGRIRAWFSLRIPQACSDDLIKETKKLANHY